MSLWKEKHLIRRKILFLAHNEWTGFCQQRRSVGEEMVSPPVTWLLKLQTAADYLQFGLMQACCINTLYRTGPQMNLHAIAAAFECNVPEACPTAKPLRPAHNRKVLQGKLTVQVFFGKAKTKSIFQHDELKWR